MCVKVSENLGDEPRFFIDTRCGVVLQSMQIRCGQRLGKCCKLLKAKWLSVDVSLDSGSSARKGVEVQVLSSALKKT